MFLLGFRARLFVGEWGLHGDVEEGRYRRSGVDRVCFGLRRVFQSALTASWEVGMPEMVRCPYCAEIMNAGTEGDWFVCPSCDHITITSYPSYLCSCQRCTQLRPPPHLVL